MLLGTSFIRFLFYIARAAVLLNVWYVNESVKHLLYLEFTLFYEKYLLIGNYYINLCSSLF